MDTLSTITILPGNKKEVDSYYNNAKNELLNGNRDPLIILKHLKAYESIIKSLLADEEIEDTILNEAEKYGNKTFEYAGAEFQIKETGISYDYSNCNDSEWNDLKRQEEEIKKKRKEREETLKVHKEEWGDPETGEVIYPPVKKGKEKVILKLK